MLLSESLELLPIRETSWGTQSEGTNLVEDLLKASIVASKRVEKGVIGMPVSLQLREIRVTELINARQQCNVILQSRFVSHVNEIRPVRISPHCPKRIQGGTALTRCLAKVWLHDHAQVQRIGIVE